MTKPFAWGINFEIIQGDILLDIKYVSNIYPFYNYLFAIYIFYNYLFAIYLFSQEI